MSQSSQSIPLSELESSPSAKFDKHGDKYAGRIVSTAKRQQTDPVTGAVKTFPSGDPMPVLVITIEDQTGERVALWAKGGRFQAVVGSGEAMLNAIGTAVRNAGADALDPGGLLAVAYTGDSAPKPGLNAAKLFTAQYQPPASPASVPVQDLFAS
jgi:hypothetical protein